MTDRNINNKSSKPFLRWAGGKVHSVPFLLRHLPRDFTEPYTYFEPFLGAGSLFFSLRPQRAVLSDNNRDLIESYKAIQKSPILISEYSNEHRRMTSEHYYYEMRSKYNSSKPSICRAALFIYLNKTCFNGIWRVNKKGEFNVPYGKQEHPSLPSKEELLRISEVLASTEIVCCDYKDIIDKVQKSDFVYLDPPYPPLSDTSNFTQYTSDGFAQEDHEELALFADDLTQKGCYVLISNSDTGYIRSLYQSNFNIFELEVTRLLRADGHRYKVREIGITNYEVK